MRGRKPKASEMKRAAGNPGRRALNDAEPVYTVQEHAPYAPRHLSAEAKREWRRVAAVLARARVLTEADLAALAAYCQAWGRWVSAERKVAELGEVLQGARRAQRGEKRDDDPECGPAPGGFYQNPYLTVANKAMEQMVKIAAEFGMTPSSRTRVKTVGGPQEKSLAEILFEGATGQDVTVGSEAEDAATD